MKNKSSLFSIGAFIIAFGALTVTPNATLVIVPVSLPPPYPCEIIGYCFKGGLNVCRTGPPPWGNVVNEYYPETETCGPVFYGVWSLNN